MIDVPIWRTCLRQHVLEVHRGARHGKQTNRSIGREGSCDAGWTSNFSASLTIIICRSWGRNGGKVPCFLFLLAPAPALHWRITFSTIALTVNNPLVQLPEACLHVPAEINHLKRRVLSEELRLAPKRCRSDHRAVWSMTQKHMVQKHFG